jgi:hypothetical protein
MRIALAFAAVAIVGLLLLSSSPGRAQSAQPYLNTTLKATGLKWGQIGGYTGILVNYTSNLPSPITGLVYARVLNPSNQAIAVSVGSCTFVPNQVTTCFEAFSSGLAAGSWRIIVFASTASEVPISGENTTSFTV